MQSDNTGVEEPPAADRVYDQELRCETWRNGSR